MRLTLTKNLLGRQGHRFLLLGMLSTSSDGRYELEDVDGTIGLDLHDAIPGEGILTEGSLILVEGEYTVDECIRAFAIGHPPSETRAQARLIHAHTVFLAHFANVATIAIAYDYASHTKATSNSILMGMVRNARGWLSRTPTEGAPEGQLTPACRSRLARDQPQQLARPPQRRPHPTQRPRHNHGPLEQSTITALEAALSAPIDLLLDPGLTTSMLPVSRMEAIMTRPGCVQPAFDFSLTTGACIATLPVLKRRRYNNHRGRLMNGDWLLSLSSMPLRGAVTAKAALLLATPPLKYPSDCTTAGSLFLRLSISVQVNVSTSTAWSSTLLCDHISDMATILRFADRFPDPDVDSRPRWHDKRNDIHLALTKTMLIVTPVMLRAQWIKEIEKRAPHCMNIDKLKV